jgi:hypothetical protein
MNCLAGMITSMPLYAEADPVLRPFPSSHHVACRYNFTHRLPDAEWRTYSNHLASIMDFSAVKLGAALGIHVASPFTQPAVIQKALTLTKAECVGERDGTTMGKLPLRLAFPEVPTCWRVKDPIEVGCGTCELGDQPWKVDAPPGYFTQRIDPAALVARQAEVKDTDGVVIRDAEHLRYYEVFREQFPEGKVPGKARHGSDPCPACGYQLSTLSQTFCVTCGHYDATLRERRVDAGAGRGEG